MTTPASQRFDSIASRYSTSQVHADSPTIRRLHELVAQADSVCDIACGAGHTGLSFAGKASRIVAVDAAPMMLQQVQRLAQERGVSVETVLSYAESVPLPSDSFDLVVSRLAAHHFLDVHKAMQEMIRLARPGGYVCVIDLEGAEDPALDHLNHRIELLHDPTHVHSYTARYWRELFDACDLQIQADERRHREMPSGLTIQRWCEIGNSGEEAQTKIRAVLAEASHNQLADLDITYTDGDFRIPVRTVLMLGRKP